VPVLGYDHGGVGELLRKMFPDGAVPLGDLDGLVRKCRTMQAGTRIHPQVTPPTLDEMLSATARFYDEMHCPASIAC